MSEIIRPFGVLNLCKEVVCYGGVCHVMCNDEHHPVLRRVFSCARAGASLFCCIETLIRMILSHQSSHACMDDHRRHRVRLSRESSRFRFRLSQQSSSVLYLAAFSGVTIRRVISFRPVDEMISYSWRGDEQAGPLGWQPVYTTGHLSANDPNDTVRRNEIVPTSLEEVAHDVARLE